MGTSSIRTCLQKFRKWEGYYKGISYIRYFLIIAPNSIILACSLLMSQLVHID